LLAGFARGLLLAEELGSADRVAAPPTHEEVE